MSRLPLALLALVVIATVPACGQGAPGLAARKAPGVSGVREAGDEVALIRAVALEAHAALLEIDAAHKRLGLNTAAGRKLTPKREPAVREGLVAVVAQLEATTVAIASKLGPRDTSPKLATLRDAFAARPPHLTDVAPADATATTTTMLYQVAQYRMKLGFLVEYALRRGIVAELPVPVTVEPAPAPAPD